MLIKENKEDEKILYKDYFKIILCFISLVGVLGLIDFFKNDSYCRLMGNCLNINYTFVLVILLIFVYAVCVITIDKIVFKEENN